MTSCLSPASTETLTVICKSLLHLYQEDTVLVRYTLGQEVWVQDLAGSMSGVLRKNSLLAYIEEM